jgi:hypothetical protein
MITRSPRKVPLTFSPIPRAARSAAVNPSPGLNAIGVSACGANMGAGVGVPVAAGATVPVPIGGMYGSTPAVALASIAGVSVATTVVPVENAVRPSPRDARRAPGGCFRALSRVKGPTVGQAGFASNPETTAALARKKWPIGLSFSPDRLDTFVVNRRQPGGSRSARAIGKNRWWYVPVSS